jgi:hypothetical protein
METIDTDYLVIGAGAVGLAFADTILAETDAHVTIVDRHGKPGGHWNDAYSFVALHQPSAFYGVNSLPLGSGRKDSVGVNAGMYELASGPEVSGYFDSVMRQQLLPTGRVRYFPMADYRGDGRFVSLLSGAETQVSVRRKTVDATYYGTTVPATHTPKFDVAPGVRMVPPNALPHLWQTPGPKPTRFAVLGAGKTAMDVGVWLLASGADPASITWVVPRDSWLLDRARIQPGDEFFEATMGAQADQMVAFAEAQSVDDLFARLEAAGLWVRIDPKFTPSMVHYATISQGEIAQLRRIANVVRRGRVRAVTPDALVFDDGRVPIEAGTLCIDCTATAVERRPIVPIFQGNRIVLQMVRVPQPAFSAALTAWVEAHKADDAAKNAICAPIPLPDTPAEFPAANIVNMMNQFHWGQDRALRNWVRASRLDGFGKVIAGVGPDDTGKQAILARLQQHALPAMANLQKLAATGPTEL